MAVVGIDLGTTNTVVASVRGGRVHVLADEQGRRLLPSVVSFHPSGDVLVGHAAKERRVVDAKNTVASVKRFIGRSWNSEELKRARQRFSFELREGTGQGPIVVARAKEYTLPEISAFVLRRAKQIAERALGEPVERAVITVPANFNELQRAATKVAGRIADLEVLRIINEPTAAALAYGLGRANKERIAIYDFGGGTFDCTLLDLSGNVFEVLATSGDSFLGGDDFDLAIAERMAEAFLKTHRYDPRTDAQSYERLRGAAEVVKIQLSTQERAHIKIREVAFGVGGAHLELDFGMTREELDALAAPLVARTFTVCEEALDIARLPVASFDKVILVGGSTRVALVRRRVEQFFGSPPLDRVNPEEVVAVGAAIQAAALTEAARRRSIPPPPVPAVRKSMPSATAPLGEAEEDITLATKVPEQLAALQKARTPSMDGELPAARATPSATPRGRSFGDTAPLPALLRENPNLPAPARPQPPAPPFLPPAAASSSVPPAPLPATTSSAPPGPRRDPPVLVDVTPRALVVETVGGWCDTVVQRNAKIPCERSRAFATSSDSQTVVHVRVAQGEDPVFRNNTYLGEVELTGLRSALRGAVTILVRFELDESGTLQVFATDVATGREAHALLQLVGIAGTQSVAAMRAEHAAVQVR
jgi:molecular chaperone DnaK